MWPLNSGATWQGYLLTSRIFDTGSLIICGRSPLEWLYFSQYSSFNFSCVNVTSSPCPNIILAYYVFNKCNSLWKCWIHVFLRLQINIVPGIFSYIWAVDWLTRVIAIESFATKHRGQTNPTIWKNLSINASWVVIANLTWMHPCTNLICCNNPDAITAAKNFACHVQKK